MREGKTRLAPLDPADWNDRTRELLGGTVDRVAKLEDREEPEGPEGPEGKDAEGSGGPLNILRTIAHHPRLLEPFLGFAATLAIGGTLPRRDSELLALRAAWNCRSAFEWGHHVHYARAAGLSEDEIARVGGGAPADGWAERDRILLRTADELHASQDVSDDTWEQLAAHFDPSQLVEIPFVVGNYTMLSMVANATGVPLEPDLPELP